MVEYTTIDHTADLGMAVCGADARSLFANAGLAMFDLIAEADEQGQTTHRVTAEGEDWPDLMVAWLRELLYLWTGKEQIVRTIDINAIASHHISARVVCTDFDAARHGVKHDIKAVTYHRIRAAQAKAGWEAAIIFDV